VQQARHSTESRGRHQAQPGRGAHERVHVPRHAAASRRPVGTVPVLATLAVLGLAIVAAPVLRDGGAEAARALGFTHPILGTASGGSGSRAVITVIDPVTGEARQVDAGADPIQVTTSETGAVIVTGLDVPIDAARVSALTPWFPPVDDDGTPTSSTSTGAPSSDVPVEIPPVPIEWTPSPTPPPTEDPTPEPTPTFDPATPSPEFTPGPTPDPTTATPDPTTPIPVPTTSTPPPYTPPPYTPPPASTSALRFSPPALSSPLVVAFPEGSARLTLDVNRDYVVTLPADRPLRNALGLTIVGGRNVVIIGGTVDVGDGDAGVRRGMYLKDATPNGTTYVEGVRFISSTTNALTEGIDIASPGAKVVLQNIAINGTLTGSYATNHADIIQAWAGPAVLQVDGLSASTHYQGMFLLPNQHDTAPVYDWSLNRMSITGDGVYLAWRDSGSYSIRTSDIYVSGSRISNGGLWPNAGAWPGVTVGRAPEAYGQSAGLGYISPGYI
jgi:hypothetical protein